MDEEFYTTDIFPLILQAEQKGLVTRTFRRLDPGQQQKIILAILDEAAEKGPQDLNIKKVASRAEVSVGSLYQYFGNRDRLLTLYAGNGGEGYGGYVPILPTVPGRNASEGSVGSLPGGRR